MYVFPLQIKINILIKYEQFIALLMFRPKICAEPTQFSKSYWEISEQ